MNRDRVNTDHREFLLKEYESLYRYIMVLAIMRLGALGASLTIFGLIISISKPETFSITVGVSIFIMMISATAIRVIAVINRGVFVLFGHVSRIEQELNEVGFATSWINYIKKNSSDSASHAFVLATRSINVGSGAYAEYLMLSTLIINDINIYIAVSVVIAVLVAITLVINERHITTQMDPAGFIDRLGFEIETSMADAKFKTVKKN